MVKFSHSLQFNAVPDWANEYIAYTNLKKTLYAIEKYQVQNAIDGITPTTPRPSDAEKGFISGFSSTTVTENEKQPPTPGAGGGFGAFLGLRGKHKKESAVARAAQEALEGGMGHNAIFPPESAAFEQGLAKELSKITAFYTRKEREIYAELDAIDRQWQLEEIKQQQERGEQGSLVPAVEMERRKSMNIDDERHFTNVEQKQLKRMMGWDRDGLVDHEADTVIDMNGSSENVRSLADDGARPTTVNGSTVGGDSVHQGDGVSSVKVPRTSIVFSDVDGSEHGTRLHGRQSSAGDLTEIIWRRENMIESDDEEKGEKKKKKKKKRSSAELVHPFENPQMGETGDNVVLHSQSEVHYDQTSTYRPGSRHQSLDNLHPQSATTDLKRSQSQHHRRKSSLMLDPRRSFSAVREMVAGTNIRENPNQKPSVYGPLTTEALLRRRLIDTFVLLSELKSYVALNYLGFQKIVKKHDKLARSHTLNTYMSTVVDVAPPFQSESRKQLDDQILRLQAIYARTCTKGNMSQAAKELRSHLREYIVWERNTIWRDMVGQERKAEGARAIDPKEQEPWILFGYPIRFITAKNARHLLLGLIGCGLFAVLMSVQIFDTREQNRCFAILITVAYFWATEVFPLYATALLVPLLTVLCQVMRDPVTNATLSTADATTAVFASMFSPTIMLLLGGFTIASALSKYGIAKSIASSVLSKAGTDPKWVLLANMFVATVASMFISNVAAPVLCFSLIQSILRTLPHKSAFAPSLIMGIALASNVGGMASPISSPQNIITIQNMNPAPSWGNWFAVSIPLCIVIDLIIWAWLMLLWRPQRDTPTIPQIRAAKEPITMAQVFICVVTVGTIILWCIENTFQAQFGNMGVIAILPLVAFFGTGLLNKEDFNNFLWTVIMLAMGGIALGGAVNSSGLLDTIAHQIQGAVSGMSMWLVLIIFSALTLVFATFVSHTVAAVIILPIVQQVGMSFADPHPRILVMGTGLVCSAAMGLPVSGFPNMNAVAQEDEMGQPYLKTMDFLKSGVPLSIMATLCVVTIGYGIMSVLGF
ncbi:phosphate transporter [Entomortierella parvispora]|uniref:Phosphate transporter n=1 Tax=Entomortierella parvispora TaxID=205924 RepID=A0A9P3HKP2_9FUNG|nr:phosphate transporter [Entomortierella parvispora]